MPSLDIVSEIDMQEVDNAVNQARKEIEQRYDFKGSKSVINLKNGIPTEKAKEIIKIIKETKLKVQSQIQEEQVRVTGKNIDDLQEIIALLKGKELDIPLQFENFRP